MYYIFMKTENLIFYIFQQETPLVVTILNGEHVRPGNMSRYLINVLAKQKHMEKKDTHLKDT